MRDPQRELERHDHTERWRCSKCGAVVYGPRDHHVMLCPLYRAEKQEAPHGKAE